MNFEVDADRVSSAATHAARTAGNLTSEANTMMRDLQALQDCWKGAAAQNFQTVVDEWEVARQQLFESLRSIHGALTTAAQQYSEVESANSRLFAR